MLAYKILQYMLRMVIAVFFRNIEVIGKSNIPDKGAVLFAGNHPNSLMDPLMVITQCGRVVHFAAKDVLFKSRFLRFFMKILGAVPIRRRMDHGDGPVDNSGTFDALYQVLRTGGCMGIFPEGISHTHSELSKLKTGAARIALGAYEDHEDHAPIYVVPVGLTYLHRQRFRSQVLVHFGDPIVIDDEWRAAHKEDDQQAVRELTDEIDQSLRSLTINAPDWDTMRFLHAVRRIYKPSGVHLSLEDYAELMRRFTEGYERVKEMPDIQQTRSEVEQYQTLLRELQLQDHDLRKKYHIGNALSRILKRVLYLVILLPMAIPGFVLHSPIMVSAFVAGDRLTARKDVVATTKLVVSILLVPMLYLALTSVIVWFSNIFIGVAILMCLPLTGFATVRVLEQQFSIGKSVGSLWRLIRFQNEVDKIQQLRKELEEKIHHAVDQYHDKSIPRMFPKA